MPLEKDQITELKVMAKLSLKKPCHFFYCESNAEGEPGLVIAKTSSAINKAKKEARMTAKKKIFITGQIGATETSKFPEFRIEKENPKFRKNLQRYFGKFVPILKKATVHIVEDEPQETTTATGVNPEAIATWEKRYPKVVALLESLTALQEEELAALAGGSVEEEMSEEAQGRRAEVETLKERLDICTQRFQKQKFKGAFRGLKTIRNECIRIGEATRDLLSRLEGAAEAGTAAAPPSPPTPDQLASKQDSGASPAPPAPAPASGEELMEQALDGLNESDKATVKANLDRFEKSGMSKDRAIRSARVHLNLTKSGIDADKAEAIVHVADAGGTGTIEDSTAMAQGMSMFPTPMLETFKANGTDFVACRESVTDHLTHLQGVQPRGWPEGMTWDDVAGAGSATEVTIATFDDGNSRAVPASGEGPNPHGSRDLIGHEGGHAYDFGGGADRSAKPLFRNPRQKDLDNGKIISPRDDYYLQGGNAGPQETFAESCAMFYSKDPAFSAQWPELHKFWNSNPY